MTYWVVVGLKITTTSVMLDGLIVKNLVRM